jgi:hypothetical protein
MARGRAQGGNRRRRNWSWSGSATEAAREAERGEAGGEPSGGSDDGKEAQAAASLDQVLRHAMAARDAEGGPGDGGAVGGEG